MNANVRIVARPRVGPLALPLAGLGAYVRKDVLEWFRTRRAVTMIVVTAGLLGLGAAGDRLRLLFGGESATGVNLDPSFNFAHAGWDPLLFLLAAFATMGLIAAERERGTLAWSLSMPLDRSSVLVSKLVSALGMFALCAAVAPGIIVAIVARVAYGSWPSFDAMIWMPLAVYASAMFVIAVNLAVSTFIRSQSAVVGTTLCVTFFGPGLLKLFSPGLEKLHPSFIQLSVMDFGAGKPVDMATPIAWAVAIALLLAVAVVRFRAVEL